MCWPSWNPKNQPAFVSVCRVSFRQVLSSGVCGCQGYDLSQGDDYLTIFDRLDEMNDLVGDFDADIQRRVVAALCTTPMNDGDHLQARKGGARVCLFSGQCPGASKYYARDEMNTLAFDTGWL